MLRDYPRTPVIPEALFLLAEVNVREGKAVEGRDLFRRLATEFGYTEWGRRATQRLSAAQR